MNLLIMKESFMKTRQFSGWHEEETETPWFSVSDTELYVDHHGEYISGILCKKAVGASSNALIHKTWLHGTEERACFLISNIQDEF